MLHRLWKPWFLYQPTWILKRAAAVMRPPPPGYRPIETSWGASITADPARTIGHSIATTGVHDIALSETPARLIAPGDTVVDAGANIGHATLLASLAAGPTGRVVAFEPHPALFEVLTGNINRARHRFDIAEVDLRQSAVSDSPGTAILDVPHAFVGNDCVASLGAPALAAAGDALLVRVETLDDVLNTAAVSVLKLDVGTGCFNSGGRCAVRSCGRWTRQPWRRRTRRQFHRVHARRRGHRPLFAAGVAGAEPRVRRRKNQAIMSVMKLLACAAALFAVLAFAEGPVSAQSKSPIVVISTSLGDITVELDAAKAPLSVENFLAYVKANHYDGTIFHRVIKGFMIQGGGMTPDMREKPTRPPIKNEAANGLKNERGTITMARTNQVDSATSQFFINTGTNNGFLDHKVRDYGYAVFGKVTSGMNVVDKIEGVKTQPGDVPAEPVIIKSIRVKS